MNNKLRELECIVFCSNTRPSRYIFSGPRPPKIKKVLIVYKKYFDFLRDLGFNWIDNLDTELFSTLNKLRLL